MLLCRDLAGIEVHSRELFKQRSTKEYLTRKLKSSSEVCEGYVILDSYAILCESKTSSSPPKRLQGCDCAVRLNAKGMSVSSDHERPTPRPHFDSQLEAVVMWSYALELVQWAFYSFPTGASPWRCSGLMKSYVHTKRQTEQWRHGLPHTFT